MSALCERNISLQLSLSEEEDNEGSDDSNNEEVEQSEIN